MDINQSQDGLELHRERICALWQRLQAVVEDLDRLRTIHCRVTEGRLEAVRLSAALGVSDQRRSNWLRRDIAGWLDRMEARYEGINTAPHHSIKRSRLTKADWDWIAQLVGGRGKLTFESMALIIRHHATTLSKPHLTQLSASTLWRNRGQLTVRLRETPTGVPFGRARRRRIANATRITIN